MRSATILAAELLNQGRVFTAIWFDPGVEKASYFDLEGNSVRRAFLLKPLEFRRISSRYSNSRYHPILKTWRAHRGIDYAANPGTPVQTTADGVVVHRGWKGSLGNMVEVRHANGFSTRYGHLSGFRRGVVVGSRVLQGEVIGYVGSTGLANGPHLHYELWRHGKPVNPLALDLPPGDPVPESEWIRWETDRRARLNLLTKLPPPRNFRSAEADRLAEDLLDRD
jgi:murein DD-endopeptidase MepM/ murein hydrolase activator NlpD